MFRWGHFDPRTFASRTNCAKSQKKKCEGEGEGEGAKVRRCDGEARSSAGESARVRMRRSDTAIAPLLGNFALWPLQLRTFAFAFFDRIRKSRSITQNLMQASYLPKVCRLISDIIGTHALVHRAYFSNVYYIQLLLRYVTGTHALCHRAYYEFL